jgi:hypothetical protein
MRLFFQEWHIRVEIIDFFGLHFLGCDFPIFLSDLIRR